MPGSSLLDSPGQSRRNNSWLRYSTSDTVIVFVHGVLSKSGDAWGSEGGTFWPDIVRRDRDFGDASVFLAGYRSDPDSLHYALTECSAELWSSLTSSYAGRPPVLRKTRVVFVCHSFGGVVCRHLIESHQPQLAEKSLGLFLVASPSLGSSVADLASALSRAYGHSQALQLTTDSAMLNDLDVRFKSMVAERRLRIVGQEICEHKPTTAGILRWVPGLRGKLIVTSESACRYFSDPITIPDSDHLSIAKPTSEEHRSHLALRAFFVKHFPAEAAAVQSQQFAHYRSVGEFLDVLVDHFDCVAERASFGADRGGFSVYWPVRVRAPMLIHAAQAFVAAGLQKHGARLVLCLDDLGNAAYSAQTLVERIRGWMGRVGGSGDQLVVQLMSDLFAQDGPARYWKECAERWLATGPFRLKQVLEVSKMLAVSDPLPTGLPALLDQKPRRLLRPAVVWAGLEALRENSDSMHILTLGGYDERPLWEAWRACTQDSAGAGHLYVPSLIRSTPSGGDQQIHMQRMELPCDSKEDIRELLVREVGSVSAEKVFEPNRLFAWLFLGCLDLPSFVAEQEHELVVSGVRLRHASQLRGVPVDDLIIPLVDKVSRFVV